MGKLSDKVAVITGGSSGIGLATAQRFVAEDAYVFHHRPATDAPQRNHRCAGLLLAADLTQPSCKLYSKARRRWLPD